MGSIILGASYKMTAKMIVIIGPSGAGKSTVAKLLQLNYGYHLERTVTTRPQRDPFDTDHIFVNDETFASMEKSKSFFGSVMFYGHSYGLPKFDPERPTVLLLRAQTIEQFRQRFPAALVYELEAPIDSLGPRLLNRRSGDRYEPAELDKEMRLGRQLAKMTIDTSRQTPEQIAALIAQDAANA